MHYGKYKFASVSGLMMHCQRGIDAPDTHHHSNEKIDPSRTNLNYDLKCRDGGISAYDYYKKNFGDLADEIKRDTGKSVRKDAVALCSWVVTAPKSLSPEKYEEFFRESYNWFSDRYGEENVVAGAVHMDETAPHMHLAFIPVMERDGHRKLCAKNLENPKSLSRAHTELQAHLTEMLGCTVELLTGETAAKGNKEVAELKMDEIRREISALTAERERLQQYSEKYKADSQELDTLKGEEVRPFIGDEHYRLSPHAYRRLHTLARVGLEREAECERLEQENAALRERTQTAEREVEMRFRAALAASDERAEASRSDASAIHDELDEMRHILAFYPDELERMRTQTETVRAMEGAYDTWVNDGGSRRDTCIPHGETAVPRDDFFRGYLDECRKHGFAPRKDMAAQSALPTATVLAAVAARLMQHRGEYARLDSDPAWVASRAAQQTARETGAALEHIGIPQARHLAVCRACGDEVDRQTMGEVPREIPGIGAAVDFRDARHVVGDLARAREVLPPAVTASLGDGSDIYEKLKYIDDPEARRRLLAKIQRERDL